MATLLADGWFYISAGGFLVSSVLFVFLLGQYRAAVEAEDDAEVEAPAAVEVVRPVVASTPIANALPKVDRGGEPPLAEPVKVVETPKSERSSPKLSEALAQVPKAEPKPEAAAPAPAPAPAAEPPKKKDSTTGGISPAVVYMQNLKLQIDHLDKELTGLKSIASQQAQQNEAILKRLSELGEHVESARQAAPAPIEDHSQDILQKLAELSAKLESVSAAAAAAPAPAPVEEAPALAPALAANAEPEGGQDGSPPLAEPVVEAAPEPAPEPAAEPVIDAAAVEAAPAPEPAPVAAPEADQTQQVAALIPETASPDETVVIEPPKEISLQPAEEPAPVPAAKPTVELKGESPAPQEAPAEPKPARKGPVWPI